MTRTVLASLVLCLLPAPPSWAASVAYHSTQATASGEFFPRTDEIYLSGVPATLNFSYVYDAAIPGVIQDGTTTFTVPTLGISVYVGAASFLASVGPNEATPPSTVSWSGDTITFTASTWLFSEFRLIRPPDVLVSASFTGSDLTPGLLPDSLGGLEGITGFFRADVNPSVGGYRINTGHAVGAAVSTPEPPALLMLALGVAGLVIVARIGVRPA